MKPLWLCLRFPLLSLEVFTQGNALLGNEQQAMIISQHKRVLRANEKALQQGITRGMSAASAHALADNLLERDRDTHKEQTTLSQLALWAYQFTPNVLPQGENTVLLEVSASLNLFGGLPVLLELIQQGLKQQQHQLRLGAAHTPKAASLLSYGQHHHGVEAEQVIAQLHHLPLTLLPAEPKTIEKLQKLGLLRLGEVLDLPKASLSKRYGKDFALYLDQLTGQAADPQHFIEPPETFNQHIHFLDGLTSTGMLQFPIKQLLGRLCEFLTWRQWHCRAFEWQLKHHDNSVTKVQVELSTPKNDNDEFYQLTQIRLEQVRVHSPIETVQLEALQTEAAECQAQELFHHNPTGKQQDPSAILDKLMNRLGKNQVVQLHADEQWLPESACTEQLATAQPSHLQRPMWLLPQPVLFNETDQLTLVTRPERLEHQWWQRTQQRDYFIAKHRSGAYYWVYQTPKAQWYLHGVFG